MNLNTQCPQCGTTFPVSMEQLQLRKGYIRCINCAAIFDGFDAVVPGSNPEAAPAVGLGTQATSLPVGSSSVPISKAPASSSVVPPTVVRHRPAVTVPPAVPYVPVLSDTAGRAGAGVDPVFTVPVDHVQVDVAQHEPDFHMGAALASSIEPAFHVGDDGRDQQTDNVSVVHRRDAPAPVEPIYLEARAGVATNPSGRSASFSGADTRSGVSSAVAFLWRIGVLLAGLVLVAQLVYIYRAQIAGQVPALRPILERACAELNCTVAYARRIDLITITGAALSAQQQAAGEQGGTMQLQLTLRNTYSKPQEWPTLELDLNDFSGTLQVRKNIGPDVYLTEAEQQHPFAANAEKVLRLPIALNGLSINGFQVRKFFP